jgi:hypothetical protein
MSFSVRFLWVGALNAKDIRKEMFSFLRLEVFVA